MIRAEVSKTCLTQHAKSVTRNLLEGIDSGYWCDTCQKNESECSLRYILSAKFSDVSGAAWLSVFSNDSEKIIDCSADELDKMKSQDDS
ncbi:replication protein A 70 kDa DNA-binding subunit B, partial [Tanacetum coccineum]